MAEQRYEAELFVAMEAAAEAAELLRARSGAERVREKARADLVTEVDEAAERAIVARIRHRFPDDVVVGEEFSGDAALAERSWIIDPVDGTVNYVHGHPFACVSVAFADRDGPAVGVIHAPFLGEVYRAVRGGGAFLNDRPIRVSDVERGEAGLYATGFPFKEGKGDPQLYFRMVADLVARCHGIRRAGAAALDMAYLAAGRVDAFFEIGLSPWDIAAGIVLVQEAGGRVAGWPGDTAPPLRTGRMVASNGRVHQWLDEQLGRHAGL